MERRLSAANASTNPDPKEVEGRWTGSSMGGAAGRRRERGPKGAFTTSHILTLMRGTGVGNVRLSIIALRPKLIAIFRLLKDQSRWYPVQTWLSQVDHGPST